MDKVLAQEVAQLANDLATKSVWNLGGDLAVVGDAIKRLLAVVQSQDARITALERAHAAASAVLGPNIGSPVPKGAEA